MADDASKTQFRVADGDALIRVTYQTDVEVTWGGCTAPRTGRTLEEAFALENLDWCQGADRADLKLRVRGGANLTLDQIAQRLHRKIGGSSFHKTDFALALLAQDPTTWSVPRYIAAGLHWLEQEVTPAPEEQPAAAKQATAA